MIIAIYFALVVFLGEFQYGSFQGTNKCQANELYCPTTRICIAIEKKCNGIQFDCKRDALMDNFDESDCQEKAPGIKLSPSEEIAIDVGESFTINCTVIKGEPPFEIQVFREVETTSSTENKRVQVKKNEATYEISHATKSQEGIYGCEANNLFGKDMARVQIRVNDAPSHKYPNDTYRDLKLLTNPSRQWVGGKGDAILLRCYIAANRSTSHYRIQWTKTTDGSASAVLMKGGIFLNPNITEDDSGIYTCTGYDRNYRATLRKTIRIHVMSKRPSTISSDSQTTPAPSTTFKPDLDVWAKYPLDKYPLLSYRIHDPEKPLMELREACAP